ncbi:UNVERIFIED_CONTAM: hypothetical protein H355_015654, partial [Colinus virginianus]
MTPATQAVVVAVAVTRHRIVLDVVVLQRPTPLGHQILRQQVDENKLSQKISISAMTGPQGSDAVCTSNTCPSFTVNGEPVMILQEAIYSSDSSPRASVCQGESSLTRGTEDATGHDSGSVKSPRTPCTLIGEDEVLRLREAAGLAARFRRAAADRGKAKSAVVDRDVQQKLAEYIRRRRAESMAANGSSKGVAPDTITSVRTRKKSCKDSKAPKSTFSIWWAFIQRRLHRLYNLLLGRLRKHVQKAEPPDVPRHEPFTRTSNTRAAEDSVSAEADPESRSYFQKLYRLVRLAFPRLWSYEGGCLVLLVSALVLRTFLSIWIASINGNVVQTIVQRNLGGFIRSLGVLIAYALPAAVVNAAIQLFEKMLALKLRRNLTVYLTRRYLKGLTFYRVPMVDIVFLSRTLVRHLGIGAPVTLVAWYAITAFAMHAVAPPLGKRTARLQELEAKYRGGLWPLLEGEITTPVASKLFYIPQRPYMPEGTLRDQVIYPMTYEDYKSLPADSNRAIDDHLEQLLDTVGLNYVLKRCPQGWDTWGDWEDILSGGEKQRMAFARLLFHKPVFAILDEATSAVSVDLEGTLYRRCGEAKITLITISHNISLLKYHDFVLRFAGLGAPGRRWSLESTEGLKRLDSYSFLLNITPASGQGDSSQLSPTAGSLKLQGTPVATSCLPSGRNEVKPLQPGPRSPPREA